MSVCGSEEANSLLYEQLCVKNDMLRFNEISRDSSHVKSEDESLYAQVLESEYLSKPIA